jgi:hypothetical protein
MLFGGLRMAYESLRSQTNGNRTANEKIESGKYIHGVDIGIQEWRLCKDNRQILLNNLIGYKKVTTLV